MKCKFGYAMAHVPFWGNDELMEYPPILFDLESLEIIKPQTMKL